MFPWKNYSPPAVKIWPTAAVMMLVLFCGTAASAQTQTATQTPPPVAPKTSISETPNSAKPAGVVQNPLQELSAYYESEVKRIAAENLQLKELYKDGLIARNEMEASDKSLLEAQARVDDFHRQIVAEHRRAEFIEAIGVRRCANFIEVECRGFGFAKPRLNPVDGPRMAVEAYAHR